jgi:hypothetical protein
LKLYYNGIGVFFVDKNIALKKHPNIIRESYLSRRSKKIFIFLLQVSMLVAAFFTTQLRIVIVVREHKNDFEETFSKE